VVSVIRSNMLRRLSNWGTLRPKTLRTGIPNILQKSLALPLTILHATHALEILRQPGGKAPARTAGYARSGSDSDRIKHGSHPLLGPMQPAAMADRYEHRQEVR